MADINLDFYMAGIKYKNLDFIIVSLEYYF